jgi:hypothetical protein
MLDYQRSTRLSRTYGNKLSRLEGEKDLAASVLPQNIEGAKLMYFLKNY